MKQKNVLDGYKVVDFTQVLAGPCCARMMAELGAEVIKIEIAPAGDITRMLPYVRNGRSGYFIQQNRGKKSLCLNPKTPEGLGIIKDLIKGADVFMEAFSPGAIGRMGLGWDVVHALNPKVVMCSISALGQSGPLSHLPGYDYIAAAYAGILDNIGYPDGPPLFTGMAIGDVSTGVAAFGAIMASLLERTKTNEGQHLDISLLDTYFHMHEINAQLYSGSDGNVVPTRFGHLHSSIQPIGIYKGHQHYIFMLCVPTVWPQFCKVIDREDIIEHPSFATVPKRVENRLELEKIIQAWINTQPNDEVILDKFREAHLPIAPIISVPEAMAHPHMIERGVVRPHHDRSSGTWQLPGLPMRFSKYPGRPDLPAPYVGEHNAQVLSQHLGYDAAKIDALHKSGVLHSVPLPDGVKAAE